MVLEKTHKVVLVNDDKNSFDYVIACLIRFCKHDPIQAEQSALITHNNGKCHIASGSFEEMYEMVEKLYMVSLIAEVEDYESDMYK